jgi:hypothetical protein
MTSVFEFLATMDRRIWHAFTFIIVIVLLLFPLGLPLAISAETQVSYNIVHALKPGDIVMINYNIAAFGWDELKGQVLSVVPHVMSQPGVKVIFLTDMDQGMIYIEQTLAAYGKLMEGKTSAPWYDVFGKKYLQDYVVLGYFPGATSAWAAMAVDFRKGAGTVDWYKNDITPFYNAIGIKTGQDVDLAISFDCTGGADNFRNHFFPVFGTPIIAGEIGVNVPGAINNYNAGQYKGIIKSTRGGAEYQYISGFKGKALLSMDAYSAIHVYLILLIVLGNIGYFGWERTRVKKGGTA